MPGINALLQRWSKHWRDACPLTCEGTPGELQRAYQLETAANGRGKAFGEQSWHVNCNPPREQRRGSKSHDMTGWH